MKVSGVTVSPEPAPDEDLAQPLKVLNVEFDADGDILLLLLPSEGGEVNCEEVNGEDVSGEEVRGEESNHSSWLGLLSEVF